MNSMVCCLAPPCSKSFLSVRQRKLPLRHAVGVREHGEAGHLDYPKFSLMGLPLGCGSIESAIRRVINLRMKSNGTFWRLPKAERILVLRASILSGRWDEDRERVKRGMQKNRKLAMPPIRESNLSKTDARLEDRVKCHGFQSFPLKSTSVEPFVSFAILQALFSPLLPSLAQQQPRASNGKGMVF